MPIITIRRDEAIKLIHDRTNSYRISKMSDKELEIFLTKIGYGNNINLPYYDCNFKIKI